MKEIDRLSLALLLFVVAVIACILIFGATPHRWGI